MNKKMQKLNKTAVAAVLAASGVVVAAPHGTASAEETFKDLTPSNSHYDSIMELFERNIISGFPDGTFKPNANVTRGQAAKMIASILNLKTSNVKNPKFKDVSTKNQFYPYIAVLAERGIINGHIDNTYRPGEVITRSQMAKILVRGFQFAEAQNLSHTFADVTAKNPNRFYIQTLVNLGITKGTSAVAFSPAKPVTRGQLASFLIRAENANVHNASVKEITKVEKTGAVTYIYLNGVKHTFNASLRDMFNTNNTEVLKGAHIEGTIVGTDIRAVNKITFNAIGAANNVLKFDGNGSTYRGTVVITGNHLRFSNWNVAGEVKIAEAEAKSVSNLYKPLTPRTIASLKLASDNIDWGTITPPSEVVPDDNDGLVDIPANNKPSLPKMKYVNHNIQFVNVTMRTLAIDANRTRITSNNDLANVRVGGYVREFELFADVTELYIESDDNVTFYGQSDIAKLYKNSYKSLNLYADSITNLIAVDNKHGWIDLGDFYYADKVIVPPLSLPHEIFNDFLNDSDKIGDLEDPSGNDIDRDPIENGVVPDQEPPTLLIKNVITDLATANVTMNSNEDGTIYYLVKKENDGEPSIREIMQYTGKMGGHKAVSEGVDTIISIPDLQDKQKYVIYAVAVDEAGNVSQKKSMDFEVLDATPPNIDPATAEGLPGGSRIEVTMNPDEEGDYYYYYEPVLATGINDYTAEEIKGYGDINYRNQGGKGKVDAAGEMKFRIQGLAPLTQYVVYVVMEDEYGNLMTEAKVMQAATTELDDDHPFIPVPGELKRVNPNSYEFYFDVSEVLDPVTANDPNNYELSGTAILNYEGQQTTIKPEYVEYKEGSKRVTIRIPSATALVLGDTIEIKVLPGVKDLAENEFINLNVTGDPEMVLNSAKYTHTNDQLPTLDIESFIKDSTGKTAQMTFTSNKAGTFYYMIVPNSYSTMPTDPRDFYDEFTETTTPWTPAIPYVAKQGDKGNNTVLVGSQMIDVPIPDTSATPFESYSLYMVVKDRSGQLTSIEKIENIIDDSRAPFIRSLDVTAREGSNTSVQIVVNSSESGTLFYKRLEKYKRDENGEFELGADGKRILNPDIEKIEKWQAKLLTFKGNINLGASDTDIASHIAEIRAWSNSPISAGISSPILENGLQEHTDYVYFFAAQDSVGNLTVFPSQSDTPIPNEDYAITMMKKEVFTDGIKPFIVNKILALETQSDFKSIPLKQTTGTPGTPGDGYIEHKSQQTFVLTFSEAIKDAADNSNNTAFFNSLKAYLQPKLPGNAITDMEWQDTTFVNDWNERKLIFTVSTRPTADITIDAKDFNLAPNIFTDLIGKPFDEEESITQYKAPAASMNRIVSAQVVAGKGTDETVEELTGSNGTTYFSSPIVRLTLQVNAVLEFGQTYYYVVQNEDGSVLQSAEDVISVVRNTFVNPTGIFQVGQAKIVQDSEAPASGGVSFQVEIMTPAGNPRQVFTTGQKVYLVTLDDYGNIVGSSNLYQTITK